MKKFFLSLVALMVSATAMFAQSILVATLSHAENVTMYYGTYALRDAYNAAVSGDVINLSGGGFQPVNISKAVTIRGTGIDEAIPTDIIGDFTINIPSEDTNRFSMEGIRCRNSITMSGTFENPYFLKCQINYISHLSNPNIKNAMFVNCKIIGSYSLYGTNSVQFINCYVDNFQNYDETTSRASFINCVIGCYGYSGSESTMASCYLMNCILFNTRTDSYGYAQPLPNSTIASHCVAINDGGRMNNIFNNSQVTPSCLHSTYAEIFRDFAGSYSDAQSFELTDSAKEQFLGADGTEVGLYGGLMPFTTIPSYPRITKMNVANKTTADGKLSVEIEVSAAE